MYRSSAGQECCCYVRTYIHKHTYVPTYIRSTTLLLCYFPCTLLYQHPDHDWDEGEDAESETGAVNEYVGSTWELDPLVFHFLSNL